MTPRETENFAQRLEAMGFLIEGLPLPDRRNPELFHERKSEIRREFRKLCVEFRNGFGAPQNRPFPKVVEHSETVWVRSGKRRLLNRLRVFAGQ